jgi:hypothetical protein
METQRNKCLENSGTFKPSRECTETTDYDWPQCVVEVTCHWECEGASAARAALPQRAPAPPPPPTTCNDTQTVKSNTTDAAPLQCNTPTVAAMRTVAKCLTDKEADCKARGGTFTHANQLDSTLKSLVSELRDASTCTITATSEWNCSLDNPTTL